MSQASSKGLKNTVEIPGSGNVRILYIVHTAIKKYRVQIVPY